MLKFLPKLVGLLKPLGAFADWIVSFGSTILKGLVTLVDWGYKAYDWTRKKVGNVFGEDGVEKFDKVSGVLKNVLNWTIGLTLAMIALSNEFGSNLVEWGKGFMSIFKHGLKRAVPRLLIKMFGKKTAASLLGKSIVTKAVVATGTTATGGASAGGVAVPGAIVLGTGLLASGIGEGAFQLNKWGEGKEEGFKNKFDEFKWWKNPLRKGWYGALFLIMKTLNATFGTIGTLLDVIGAPFRYLVELIRYPFLDEAGKAKQRRNLGKFDARIREAFRKIFHTLSLGFVGKGGKGSWGSLYGKEGTDAMGYTRSGKSIDKSTEISEFASYDSNADVRVVVNGGSQNSSMGSMDPGYKVENGRLVVVQGTIGNIDSYSSLYK